MQSKNHIQYFLTARVQNFHSTAQNFYLEETVPTPTFSMGRLFLAPTSIESKY